MEELQKSFRAILALQNFPKIFYKEFQYHTINRSNRIWTMNIFRINKN